MQYLLGTCRIPPIYPKVEGTLELQIDANSVSEKRSYEIEGKVFWVKYHGKWKYHLNYAT